MVERPGSVKKRDFVEHGNNCFTVIIDYHRRVSYQVIYNSS